MLASRCGFAEIGCAVCLTLLTVIPGGCSGDSIARDAAKPFADATHQLHTELAALDASETPPGIPEADFILMKSELRRMLTSKPASQLTAQVPVTDQSRADLVWDADSATLTWHYFNNGDYDQNGEVNASDLTPLGIHYGKSADLQSRTVIDDLVGGPGASPFGVAVVESAVDGNADGIIGITDITPLGQNFRASVSGYRIYADTSGAGYPTANDAESSRSPLAEVTFSEAGGTPGLERLEFTYQVADPQPGMTYWVRPVYLGIEGTPSNPAGAGLDFGTGSLALTGISPVSAEPGELIWLEFNTPLASQLDGLTVVVAGQAEAEFNIGDLAIRGNFAGTAAPLLAPGPVSFEAFQDGVSVGSTQLIIREAATELTVESTEQEFARASIELENMMFEYIEWLQYTPDFDLEAAEAEFADFNAALGGVVEYFCEELNALSPANRTAVLAYL